MEIKLNSGEKNIFILGAGASVDYGLPLWKDLIGLIKNELNREKNVFEFKTEILEWLKKIEDGIYKTIDACIAKESVSDNYRDTGDAIEKEIWNIIYDIFNNVQELNQKDLDNTWISNFNTYILKNNENFLLDDGIFFINYNYDSILSNYFCNLDTISEKEKSMNLSEEKDKMNDHVSRCFCPHGSFLNNKEKHGHLDIEYITPKTINKDNYGSMDIVSCYDSKNFDIGLEDYHDKNYRKLFILGLGGGLEFNLSKINIKDFNIEEIHITISDKKKVDNIKKFLSTNFSVDIKNIFVYDDCNSLVKIFKKK